MGLNYCGRSEIFSIGDFDSQTDQFDAVINVSGVRSGAATTSIRIIKKSDIISTDRTSAFFTIRTDTSIYDRERSIIVLRRTKIPDQDATSTICTLSVVAYHVHLPSFSPSLSLCRYLQDNFHTPLRRGVYVFTLILNSGFLMTSSRKAARTPMTSLAQRSHVTGTDIMATHHYVPIFGLARRPPPVDPRHLRNLITSCKIFPRKYEW